MSLTQQGSISSTEDLSLNKSLSGYGIVARSPSVKRKSVTPLNIKQRHPNISAAQYTRQKSQPVPIEWRPHGQIDEHFQKEIYRYRERIKRNAVKRDAAKMLKAMKQGLLKLAGVHKDTYFQIKENQSKKILSGAATTDSNGVFIDVVKPKVKDINYGFIKDNPLTFKVSKQTTVSNKIPLKR